VEANYRGKGKFYDLYGATHGAGAMIGLAIEAATEHVEVLVRGAGGEPLACEVDDVGHGHTRRLSAMVALALERAGVRPAQLEWVAADLGPGSFTGVRVGLATAEALGAAFEYIRETNTAMDAGDFLATWLVEEIDLGMRFTLTADGAQSGLHAETMFTDAAITLFADSGRSIKRDAFARGSTVFGRITSALNNRCYRIEYVNPSATVVATHDLPGPGGGGKGTLHGPAWRADHVHRRAAARRLRHDRYGASPSQAASLDTTRHSRFHFAAGDAKYFNSVVRAATQAFLCALGIPG
jgi:hypothetical protein